MKRNLRFWTRYTWESTYVEWAVVAVLAVLTALGADQMQFQLLASLIPYYLFISAVLCIIMLNYSSQTLYIPLLISMGETRRNILLGFHYYRCLIIAATVALSALLWALVPCEMSSIGLRSIPTILTVLVIASALGSLMGTIYAKCKWLSIAIVVLICGSMGGMGGFLFSGGFELVETSAIDIVSILRRLPWWLAAAALALLVVDVVFQWLLLRRQEVKL